MNTICPWAGCLLVLSIAILVSGCMLHPCSSTQIDRQFATPEEETLIAIAEQFCPAREDVLAAARPEERDALGLEAGDGCLWWHYWSFRIPYAITADAVDYYKQCADSFQQDPSLCQTSFPYADLNYQAGIEFMTVYAHGDTQYDNVYVVQMSLAYCEYYGWLSAEGFEKQRVVVLTAQGEVLAVYGDGPTDVIVS